MTSTTLPTTPGFNHHLVIEFSFDKNGRRIAQFQGLSLRLFRVKAADADAWIAQGFATLNDGRPFWR